MTKMRTMRMRLQSIIRGHQDGNLSHDPMHSPTHPLLSLLGRSLEQAILLVGPQHDLRPNATPIPSIILTTQCRPITRQIMTRLCERVCRRFFRLLRRCEVCQSQANRVLVQPIPPLESILLLSDWCRNLWPLARSLKIRAVTASPQVPLTLHPHLALQAPVPPKSPNEKPTSHPLPIPEVVAKTVTR